jgi:hypothetical protein
MAFLDSISNLKNEVAASGAYAQFIQDDYFTGIFITKENAEAVNFKPSKDWQKITKSFGGEKKEGYFCSLPSIVVLDSTPLSMFDIEIDARTNNRKEVYAGKFDKDYYASNKKNTVLKLRYLVIFVDDKFNPLHTTPLFITVKGGFGRHFNVNFKNFKDELQTALRLATGKNFAFTSEVYQYAVYQPKFERYKTEYNSMAATVSGFNHPTAQNLDKVLAVENQALMEAVQEGLKANIDISFDKATKKPQDEEVVTSEPSEVIEESKSINSAIEKMVGNFELEDNDSELPY